MHSVDYPYVRAWCEYMAYDGAYKDEQVKQARSDKAPDGAVFYSSEDRRWTTMGEIQSHMTRSLLVDIANRWWVYE